MITDGGVRRPRPVVMLSMERPIGQLVREHAACAIVLARYRLDYQGDGHRSLRDVCADRGVDPARVLVECERLLGEPAP